MRVRFTPSGRIQFLTAIAYIQRDDPRAALRFRNRAAKALRRLLRYPESGRLIPEFPDLPLREVVVPPYRFFYRREGKVIWVVAAWHGAQIPNEPRRKADV
ncbi:MAG: type II toxin-antitoxin system RelE/ParE family toxin [Acidobacteriia bacterium]|nr:type II toxin-antitoxin system RelE/ParE family toxin [Terriglobia bacterium]